MDELMGKIAVLRAAKLFKELSIDALQEMAFGTERRRMTAGDVIFNEGDVPDGFYLVSSGTVLLRKHEKDLTVLEQDAFFGESDLVSQSPRMATAICRDSGVLLYLDNATFNNLIDSYPDIMWVVIKKVSNDLHSKNASMDNVARPKKKTSPQSTGLAINPLLKTGKKIIAELQQIPIFNTSPIEELSQIAQRSQLKKILKDELIFSEGDPSDHVYFILKGSVLFKHREKELLVLNKYDYFGEVGVFSDKQRMASATAMQDGRMVIMNKLDFKTMVLQHPTIAHSILSKIISYYKVDYRLIHKDIITKIQQSLPTADRSSAHLLFFERIGLSKDSNMTILDLSTVAKSGHVYSLNLQGFEEKKKEKSELHIRTLEISQQCDTPPRHAEVDGIWDETVDISGEGNNILGGNGKFFIDEDKLDIPVMEATQEALAYYGCSLLTLGEWVEFPLPSFPIWTMLIGKDYLKNFIMTSKGGGLYIEYHTDKPHIHMPMNKDASGYYLLVKKVTSAGAKIKNKYHLTAFKIPFGKAVYTCKGVIHCDAGLIGEWMVGYDNAHTYSTALIRTDAGMMVDVNFSL